jgi:hypothetical protein
MRRIRAAVTARAVGLALAGSAAISGCGGLGTNSGQQVVSVPVRSGPATPVAVSAPPGAAGSLVARLVRAPADSRPWSGSWGRSEVPSLAEFLKQFYAPGDRAHMADTLRTLGLEGLAHRAWVAGDGNQIDLVLLRFTRASGAAARYAAVTSATASENRMTALRFGAYGPNEARAFRESGRDADGFVRARVYVRPPGSVLLLEAFYFSPHRFARSDLLSWTEAQIARLG